MFVTVDCLIIGFSRSQWIFQMQNIKVYYTFKKFSLLKYKCH